MATYIEIKGNRYEAAVTGKINDKEWNGRASKAIRVPMSYEKANNIFEDDVEWSIVQHYGSGDEFREEVFDNSIYSMVGDITDHRDGTITVKMGVPTAEEILEVLIGGL